MRPIFAFQLTSKYALLSEQDQQGDFDFLIFFKKLFIVDLMKLCSVKYPNLSKLSVLYEMHFSEIDISISSFFWYLEQSIYYTAFALQIKSYYR